MSHVIELQYWEHILWDSG